MDEFCESDKIIQRKRSMKCSNNSYRKDYISRLITRILVSIILVFGVIIACNIKPNLELFIDDMLKTKGISFTKIGNLYNKYFGNIIPFEDIYKDSVPVSNNGIAYNEIKNYKDGFVLSVSDNYLVPVIESGVVVFIGEKEGLGKTIIIQGLDEVDYWYSNIENISCSLYDYVDKNNIIASTIGDKLYLTFKKGNEFLDYDEVME